MLGNVPTRKSPEAIAFYVVLVTGMKYGRLSHRMLGPVPDDNIHTEG